MRKKWSGDEDEKLNSLYTTKSYQELEVIFGRSKNSINTHASKLGIFKGNSHPWRRKYTCDEYYFDTINTPEKAYWLGFIWADGTVTKKGFSITIRDYDAYLLDYLKNSIGWSGEIKPYGNMRRINICSQIIRNSLIKIGIVPNKTYSENIVEVPFVFLSHYIRGMLDGDGCLYKDENHFFAQITNTKTVCEWLQNRFTSILNINSSVRPAIPSVAYICTISGRNQVNKFLDWIYKDAEIFLSRKRNKLMTVL